MYDHCLARMFPTKDYCKSELIHKKYFEELWPTSIYAEGGTGDHSNSHLRVTYFVTATPNFQFHLKSNLHMLERVVKNGENDKVDTLLINIPGRPSMDILVRS